jgi:membrane protein DedA with SNARE-associated domain
MILDMTMLALFNASEFFQWFVENANYLFVFIFMTIESSFIPFPSEVVVPPAAYLACTGTDMNFGLVIVFATLGALTGAFINYYLALWIGRPIVYRFANSRFGHACLIDQAKVEKAEAYFEKKGAISTFVGRLIPAVRQLISIPAGLARMNIGVFALFTTLGAGIWNIVLAGLGYWLSLHVSREELFDAIEKYNSYLTYAGYAIGVFCVAYILWNAFKTKKNN